MKKPTQKFVRWAVHAAEQARIRQLPGISQTPMTYMPAVGEEITHPYLVDPATLEPCPLRVVEILEDYSPEFLVIVVGRAQ